MKDWKNNLLDQVIRENLFEQTLSPIWTGFAGERKIQSLKQQFNETGKVIDGFTITSNTEISDIVVETKIKQFIEYNKDHVYLVSDNIKIGNQYKRDIIYQWKIDSSNYTKIAKLNTEYTTTINSLLNYVRSYDYDSILINADRIMNRVPNISDRQKLLPVAFNYSLNKADIFHYENNQLVANGVLQSPIGEYIKLKYPDFYKLIENNWVDVVISGMKSIYTKQTLLNTLNSINSDYKIAKNYQKQAVTIFNDIKSYFASKTELKIKEFINSDWTTLKSKLNDSDNSIYTWYRLRDNKSLMYYFNNNKWYFANTESYIRYMYGSTLKSSDTGVVTDQQVIEKLNALKPDINKKIRESIQTTPIKFGETGERIEYVQSILYKILKKLQVTNSTARDSKTIKIYLEHEYGTYDIETGMALNYIEMVTYQEATNTYSDITIDIVNGLLSTAGPLNIVLESKQLNEQVKPNLNPSPNRDKELRDRHKDLFDTDNIQPAPKPKPEKKKETPRKVDVAPKPNVTPGNGLTPAAAACKKHILSLPQFAKDKWKSIGGVSHRTIGATAHVSEHADGNALDFMLRSGQPEDIGQELADYLVSNADKLLVRNVIYNKKIWNSPTGWHTYKIPAGGSPHTDHVHVDFIRNKKPQVPVNLQWWEIHKQIKSIIKHIDNTFFINPEKSFGNYSSIFGDDEEGAVKKMLKYKSALTKNFDSFKQEKNVSKRDLENMNIILHVLNGIIKATQTGDSYTGYQYIWWYHNKKWEQRKWNINWIYL